MGKDQQREVGGKGKVMRAMTRERGGIKSKTEKRRSKQRWY